VKAPVAQVVTVQTGSGLEGDMETIGEHNAYCGSINLVILKADILSALSSVSSATTTEQLQQADAAYKKALCTARRMGYRPHVRAVDGQQIQVEWVALRRSDILRHSRQYCAKGADDIQRGKGLKGTGEPG
jgi:hypothetical protein